MVRCFFCRRDLTKPPDRRFSHMPKTEADFKRYEQWVKKQLLHYRSKQTTPWLFLREREFLKLLESHMSQAGDYISCSVS